MVQNFHILIAYIVYNAQFLSSHTAAAGTDSYTELYSTNEICVIPRNEKDIVSHCVSCVFVQSSPVVRPAE